MDAGTSQLLGTRAIEFILAAAGPVSLDELVAWDLARPSDLWRWLEDARHKGWIEEDAAAGPGHFAFCEEERRNEVVAAAVAEDWRWLAGRPALVPSMLANARRAVRSRQLGTAMRLFRALVQLAPREAFPGGARGWLDAVVECVRAFRVVDWLDAQVLDEALDIAEASGDIRLQATLSASRGLVASRALRHVEAREYLGRALEASRAAGDRTIAFEVHVQIALGHALRGEPHEAIATFEGFLGNVPEELVPLPPELALPLDPLPEVPLGVLALAYAQVGQYGRALELLHRLRAAGRRLHRPDLTALADAFLSAVHANRRELEPARATAGSAFEYWRSSSNGPYFLWYASIPLAWSRMAEGRLTEAREVLEVGQRARLASGIMSFGGSALFEVLDRMDVEDVAPPDGLGIESEIDRMLSWPGGYMAAVAHRFRARRLARGPVDEGQAAEIDHHHARGIEHLRSSRASPSELARCLEEASAWAARRGREEEAARLGAEAAELLESVGLGSRASTVEPARVASALIELGRLATLVDGRESVWGDLASRLCGMLGVERCALVEETNAGARVLAARGGGSRWTASVAALAKERALAAPGELDLPSTEDDPAPEGQLLAVPFGSARLARRGWAVLENRHSRALVTASHRRVLEALGAQLGVILENVEMWNELVDARQRLAQENRYYRQAAPVPSSSGGRIVGDSPALRRVLELIQRVAPATTAVLIQGETGVGKELIAREIHRSSPRRDASFIAVHIASLAPGLVASSLFGHERGAFTGATEQARGRFELADGGTLFLDEIGELNAEDQVRLLRVLQEGTFERVGGTRSIRSDFRLLAATNRDLAAEVRAGRFREDLYFRLAAFPIHVPPLRERTEEIPTLALFFMGQVGRKLAVKFEGVSEADMARLVGYRWPGNVRELEHVIERAALLSDPPTLRIPQLSEPRAMPPGPSSASTREWITMEEAERRYLRQVIEHTRGRITGTGGAAEILGMKPSTVHWRIDKLGLRGDVQRARVVSS